MPTVFFSWQIDTRPTEGRNFLDRVLERAIQQVSADIDLEEAAREGLELDRDTKGVAGQPPIVETIFKKIDQAAVFVPDLTFTSKRLDGRPAPNPNVLIEYGWALRSLGHSRMVPIMNIAYGEPGDQMPFDMRHLRHPILYNLPDGADDATRRAERERLTKVLAEALRNVLGSEEYRASLPKPPAPPAFAAVSPKDGPARFRPPGEPLGMSQPHFPHSLSEQSRAVSLVDGPALWLRLMPIAAPGRDWLVSDIEKAANGGEDGFLPPLRRAYRSYDYLRAEDGFGVYEAGGPEGPTRAVVFVFTTGEVWTIEASLVSEAKDYSRFGRRPGVPTMEQEFKTALHRYDRLLKRLGLKRPFRWIAGYDGIVGAGLYYDPPPGLVGLAAGPVGTAVADRVEATGLLEEGVSPAAALKPLFVKLFDICGLTRPDQLDALGNPE